MKQSFVIPQTCFLKQNHKLVSSEHLISLHIIYLICIFNGTSWIAQAKRLSLKVKLCHLPNFICFDESFFLLLRYLNFCPDFFGHVGKRLDKKVKVNFKFMISQTGKQKITMYKLPNIYRRKSNQIMKFSLLKLFSWKLIQKIWWRNQSQTLS